jgi:beta-barrel assembly-enhancing protease
LAGLLAGALVAPAATPAQPAGPSPAAAADPRDLRRRAEAEEVRLFSRIPPLADPALDAYIGGLVARLVPDGAPDAAVAVVVLRDPSLNAFSLPHGRIYVSTGLLTALRGEDELAMILAREAAHIAAGHAARAAAAARPAVDPPSHRFKGLGLDLASTAAVTGFGPELEREADADGLMRLARAGFDLDAAARAFGDLRGGRGGDRGPQTFLMGNARFLDDRGASIQALRRDGADAPAAPAPGGPDLFAEALRVAVRENAMLEGRTGRFAAGRAQLARALRLAPGDPVAHLHAGDLDRLEAQRSRRGRADRRRLQEEAQIAYERAALLAPEWPDPFHRLGLLAYELGQLDAARAAFERYLAVAPDGPDARRITEYLAALPPVRR